MYGHIDRRHLHSVKIFLRFMFWEKLEIRKAYHCLELHFQFRFALSLMRMVACAVSRLPRSLTLCSCLKFFRVVLFMFKRIPSNCKSFVYFFRIFISCYFVGNQQMHAVLIFQNICLGIFVRAYNFKAKKMTRSFTTR